MTVLELTTQLEAILGADGLVADLEELTVPELPESKVAGIVAHPAFENLELPGRRELIFPALRAYFGARSVCIGTLLLFTPEEYAALHAA